MNESMRKMLTNHSRISKASLKDNSQLKFTSFKKSSRNFHSRIFEAVEKPTETTEIKLNSGVIIDNLNNFRLDLVKFYFALLKMVSLDNDLHTFAGTYLTYRQGLIADDHRDSSRKTQFNISSNGIYRFYEFFGQVSKRNLLD